MRAPHVSVGGDEGFLGPVQIALPQANRAELGQRPPELSPHPRSKVVARAERFGLGGIAGPRNPQDLGAMHAAAPVEAAEGAAGPPPFHRIGPLGRHLVQRQALRRAHELTQHHPGGEVVDLAGEQQRADVFELGETVGEVAGEDRDPGRGSPADHDGRRVPEPLAQVDGRCG